VAVAANSKPQMSGKQPIGRWTSSRPPLGLEKANPTGDIYLITDNLASHKSPPTLGSGWRPTRELRKSSSRKVRPGSTCKKHGGDCAGGRLLPGRASPTRERSSLQRKSPQSSSIAAPNRGCGAVHHAHGVTADDLLFTAFEERSSRRSPAARGCFAATSRRTPPAGQCARRPGARGSR
jgi:hypothetical protein